MINNQTGGNMKGQVSLLIIAALLMILTMKVSLARPSISELEKICSAKANVANFVIRNRAENSRDDMMVLLDKDWKNVHSKVFDHHIYVDMVRIVNDAYRTEMKGGFRIDGDTDLDKQRFVSREVAACARNGF